MTNAVVSVYPMPVAPAGEGDVVVLSDLRLRGAWSGLRALRSRRYDVASFRLADGDPAEMASIAAVVLGFMRAAVKELRGPGGDPVRIGRLDVLRAGLGFAWAGLTGLLAAAANFRDARRPLRVPGRRVGQAGSAAYLRASYGLPRVGGSVGHTSGIVNALARSGLDVRVLACARPVGLREPHLFEPVALPATATYPHELNAHRYGRRFFRAGVRVLSGDATRFLYARYAINDLSAVRLARRLGRPLVLEYNGSEVWAQRHWGRRLVLERLSRRMELACLREADLVVTVSEALERELLDLGLPERRVLFYPNCVDTTEFDPARFDEPSRLAVRARFGFGPRDHVTTFVGTFGRWHGAEVLARAIARLPEAVNGRPLRFLFVGDGVTAPEARAAVAAELGKGRVVFAGARPQEETPEILAASDTFASPHVPNPDGTPFFGSPTKLFEYMAMARPIVASDLDQIGRILRGWRPGEPPGNAATRLAILVEPGDPAALAEGLRTAAALDVEQAKTLGTAARAAVMGAFRWENCVAAVVARLRSLEEEAHG